MDNLNSAVQVLIHGSNTLFILLGAVMVLAMHAGFAFLEVGTVRLKNRSTPCRRFCPTSPSRRWPISSSATGLPTA